MNFKHTQLETLTHLNRLKVDKILVIALLLGLAFGLYGLHWGWVECWNPDQMAFQDLFKNGKLPFNPNSFEKPPFHTYFNFFLSVLPIKLLGDIFHLSSDFLRSAKLLWSRTLTLFLFLGSISLVFYITKRFFGIFAARIIALVFSSSAGFLTDAHFLTADIPVLFWMLVAFYFAQNIALEGKVSDYALAGFFTGIATATKYNGLSVGIAIVVAHILLVNTLSWKKIILSKKLFLGLFLVLIGFLIGNPFALLDHSTFLSDFMYNYIVTPVYEGKASTEHTYWKFFSRFPEIIGFPSLLVFAIAFLFSIYFMFTTQEKRVEKKGILLLLAVFLLYYYKFGSFPRLPVRFVMPIVPFWLIMSGPFWNKIKPNTRVIAGILTILISYNLICCFYVGKRFAEDPRMQAQEWVKKNILDGSSIESSRYTPKWNYIPGVDLKDERMPPISIRRKSFEQLFPADSWVMGEVRNREKDETAIGWYSLEQLMKRQPDYIAFNSIYYKRFFTKTYETKNFYITIKEFFGNLLDERYPYKIVFDKTSATVPRWIYPQRIQFVDNRITILARLVISH